MKCANSGMIADLDALRPTFPASGRILLGIQRADSTFGVVP
jgi:hypothetical protein